MAATIGLRADDTSDDCLRFARNGRDAKQTRRLLALASIYDGRSRSHAANLGSVGPQAVLDRVLRDGADGPARQTDRKALGAEPKPTPNQLRALVYVLEQRPITAIQAVVRWRLSGATWYDASRSSGLVRRIIGDLG